MCYLSIGSIINVIYSIAWNIYLFKHAKKYLKLFYHYYY